MKEEDICTDKDNMVATDEDVDEDNTLTQKTSARDVGQKLATWDADVGGGRTKILKRTANARGAGPHTETSPTSANAEIVREEQN